MIKPPRTLIAIVVTPAILLLAAWLVLRLHGWPLYPAAEADAGVDTPARRAARGECIPLFIEAREQPVALKPNPGLADAVTEEQLVKALCAAMPLWHPPDVNPMLHELKLWGRRADFTKAMVGQSRSGAMMVQTLLSDKLCRDRTPPNGGSFLIDSPFGIHVVRLGAMDAVEGRGEGHFGKLLMVLGEAGVPLSAPVITVSGRAGTVRDILQDAILRFSWTRELEFIGTALTLWLPPETKWTDQFGNRYSFDELAEHLMIVPHGTGPCGGCHVPYALATILAVDRQNTLLSVSIRERVLRWFADLSAGLEKTQRSEGGWDRDWPGDGTTREIYSDPVLDRLTVTGHHLEWIALAPASVRPCKPTVARAVAAYVGELDKLPPMRIRSVKTMLPCSHGARALCLLQAKEPYVTWRQFWDAGRLVPSPGGGYELRNVVAERR